MAFFKPMKKALFDGLTLLASYFGDSYDSENEAFPKNGIKKRYRQNPSGPGGSLEQRPSKMPKLLPIYQDSNIIGYTAAPSSTDPEVTKSQRLALDPKNILSGKMESVFIPVLNQNAVILQKGDWRNYCGGITQDDEARLNNYIYKQITKMSTPHPSSLGLCFAHARTLLVAHRYRSEFLEMTNCPSSNIDGEAENFILQEAWKRLDEYTGRSLDGSVKIEPADVDMEAMVLFDWAMFDRSKKAGVAGNMQWGLDVGMHEENWNPYFPEGPEIYEELRKGNQSELKFGPAFNMEEKNAWEKGQQAKDAQHNSNHRPAPRATGKAGM
ncbi:hypothetical protein D9757_007782 [Collybiopsis confluens]|uniref:Uncharacterized protein n=1 Tax=Collybiopsis confluens TaxID=2823264 RepID=A0A8H5HQM5_9AGAR|nr:hypothetical protein D9757_007782 [Collybiopsis confluens]